MRGTTVSKIHKMDVFLNFWFHSKGERERERWVLNNYRKNPECVTTVFGENDLPLRASFQASYSGKVKKVLVSSPLVTSRTFSDAL